MTAPPFRVAWSEEAIRALGTRCTVPQAGSILAGLSESQAYEAAKRGDLGVPILKVGRRLVVPVRPILELLGLAPTDSGDREHRPGQAPSGAGDQAGQGATGAAVLQMAARRASGAVGDDT